MLCSTVPERASWLANRLMSKRVQQRVSMIAYFAYRLFPREGQFNPVLKAGLLTQQFILDSYLYVEENRLY